MASIPAAPSTPDAAAAAIPDDTVLRARLAAKGYTPEQIERTLLAFRASMAKPANDADANSAKDGRTDGPAKVESAPPASQTDAVGGEVAPETPARTAEAPMPPAEAPKSGNSHDTAPDALKAGAAAVGGFGEPVVEPDGVRAFRQALLAAGLVPPAVITVSAAGDKGFSRCGRADRPGGNKDGAYVLRISVLNGKTVYHGVIENHASGKGWQRWTDSTVYDTLTLDEQKKHDRRSAELSAQARKAQEQQQLAAAMVARAMQDTLPAASAEHPYLTRKGYATVYGDMRVGPWPQRGKQNCLLLALRDSYGVVWSMQAIYPAKEGGRDKDFLKGGRKTGLFYVLGTLDENTRRVYVAEGYATAAAIHEATGCCVVVAWDKGNLRAVCAALHQIWQCEIVVCADRDQDGDGVVKAHAAAAAVGGSVVVPVFNEQCDAGSTDFDDLRRGCGAGVVKAQVEAVKPAATKVTTTEEAGGAGAGGPPPNAGTSAGAGAGAGAGGAASSLPVLEVDITQADRMVREVCVVLAGGMKYFRRGPRLVAVAKIEATRVVRGMALPSGTLLMMPATKSGVQQEMSRIAKVVKRDGRARKLLPVLLPDKLAEMIVERGFTDAAVPELLGVSSIPLLRLDGSLHCKEGYDPVTRMYVTQGLDFAAITACVPDRPTLADAQAALAVLRVPLAEFPWKEPGVAGAAGLDESVVLAGLATAATRHLYGIIPAVGLDAPEYRSGKTLLAFLIASVMLPSTPPAMTMGFNSDEFEKRIDSVALDGDAVTVIDNISRPVRSDALAAALTSGTYQLRVLGKSGTISVPFNTLVLMTGANLRVSDDMVNRSLIATIDSGMEHPESRMFKIANLLDYMHSHRGVHLVAIFTIMRAFIQAGMPEPVGGTKHDFLDWARLVRNALLWAGCADVLLSQERAATKDPSKEELQQIFSALQLVFGTSRWTVSDIKERVRNAKNGSPATLPYDGRLADAVEGRLSDRDGGRELGRWFDRHRDRTVDGFKLVKDGTTQGAAAWKFYKVGGTGAG